MLQIRVSWVQGGVTLRCPSEQTTGSRRSGLTLGFHTQIQIYPKSSTRRALCATYRNRWARKRPLFHPQFYIVTGEKLFGTKDGTRWKKQLEGRPKQEIFIHLQSERNKPKIMEFIAVMTPGRTGDHPSDTLIGKERRAGGRRKENEVS